MAYTGSPLARRFDDVEGRHHDMVWKEDGAHNLDVATEADRALIARYYRGIRESVSTPVRIRDTKFLAIDDFVGIKYACQQAAVKACSVICAARRHDGAPAWQCNE